MEEATPFRSGWPNWRNMIGVRIACEYGQKFLPVQTHDIDMSGPKITLRRFMKAAPTISRTSSRFAINAISPNRTLVRRTLASPRL